MNMVCVKMTGLGLASALLSMTLSTSVNARQLVDFNANICHSASRALERANSIPTDLLTAISLAETGRWNPKKKEMFAWPWTVTSGKSGTYYPSKGEAIAAVKRLGAAGVTNIDVGCMQINLNYHPNAFKSIDEAFDPKTNIGYASKFLGELHKLTGSWTQAAANYHSINPELNIPYMEKVTRLWQRVSGRSLEDLPSQASPNPAYLDPSTRVAQMALINSRFRARLVAERKSAKPARARRQLEEWRQQRTSTDLLSRTAAVNRANLLRRNKEGVTKKSVSFAEKRKAQMAAWRKTGYIRR